MLRNLKKSISICVGAVLLFTSTAALTTVEATSISPKITLEIGTINAYPGEDIILPISVSNNDGFVALKCDIAYDKNIITVTDGNKSTSYNKGRYNFMCNPLFEVSTDVSAFSMIVYGLNNFNFEQDGVIANMSISISDNAEVGSSIPIEFIDSSIDISDINYTALDVSTLDGAINIIEKPEETTTTTVPVTTTTTTVPTTTVPVTTTTTTIPTTTTTVPVTTTTTTVPVTTTTTTIPTTTTTVPVTTTTTTVPTTTTTVPARPVKPPYTFCPPMEDIMRHVGKNINHHDINFFKDILAGREKVSKSIRKYFDFNQDKKANVFDCLFMKVQQLRENRR